MSLPTRPLLAPCAGLALLLAVGCGDDLGVEPVPPGSRVLVLPERATLLVSDSLVDVLQLRALAIGPSGDSIPGQRFEWSSSDTSVAVVDERGEVVARAPGTATITADAGEKARATITVRPRTVALEATPSATRIVAGEPLWIDAAALDSLGALAPGVLYEATSSAPAVVTVDSIVPPDDGATSAGPTIHLTPRGAGTATIAVRANGSEATVDVTVLPRDVTGASSGWDSSCGLMADGRVACWGLGESRQLAAEADSVCFGDRTDPPEEQGCALRPIPSDSAVAFQSVSVGDHFACGVSTAQRLYCWGADSLGELGRGRVSGRDVVGPATVFTTERFTQVELGGRHACAIAVTAIAYCWGADALGQLGDTLIANSTTPIPVAGLTSVTSVAAGREHSCAVASGRAYCWGSNEHGQLGAATGACAASTGLTTPCAQSPVAVGGGLTFASVTAGLDHSCGITTAGAAYCWGADSLGQLGRGSAGGSATSSPQPVAGGLTFAQISAGYRFTCGVTTAGVGYCWGAGAYGQRGDGSMAAAAGSPRPVSGGVALARIAAGRRHACATARGGAVSCWGSNMYGALGNELQAARRSTPQAVAEVRPPRRE